ncbi:MAG: hypothetical protein ACTSU5_17300 [Promethearchaeota archaeon]
MAKGIVIISWDEFEGATIEYSYPPGVEDQVNDSIIQHIQISHNFVESWMITQEENFNGISFYDPTHGHVILLVLDQYEDGQDYRTIIDEINKMLLDDPDGSKLEDLEKIWELTSTVYKAREAVMLKLAQEVADLKLRHHEVKRSVEIISRFTRDGATKILLFIALNEPATREQIAKHVQVTDRWLDHLLEELKAQGLIAYKEDQDAYYIL